MYIRQALDLLDGLIPAADDNLGMAHLQKLIVFAIMWSLGALLELDDRKKVGVECRILFLYHHRPTDFSDCRRNEIRQRYD